VGDGERAVPAADGQADDGEQTVTVETLGGSLEVHSATASGCSAKSTSKRYARSASAMGAGLKSADTPNVEGAGNGRVLYEGV
jgi:hypothetical protein